MCGVESVFGAGGEASLSFSHLVGKYLDIKMLEKYPEVMTPEQVANALQLSMGELTELLESNELPAKRLGKFWRISKQTLINFLNPQIGQVGNKSDTPYKSNSQEQSAPFQVVDRSHIQSNDLIPHETASPSKFESKFEQETTKPESELISSPEILKRLYEIDARFKVHIQTAQIELIPADLTEFPKSEFTGSRALEAKNIFDRIKNKYDNAIKLKELHPKFQRTQRIFDEADNLSKLYPQSPVVKSYLGYFSYLNEKYNKSYEYYRDAALLSNRSEDWYNFAVLSLRTSHDYSCHALSQFFASEDITLSNAWYLYIRLIHELRGGHEFYNLFEKIHSSLSDSELEIIFDSGIFLLSVLDRPEIAEAQVKKLLENQNIETIIYGIFEILKEAHGSSYFEIVNKLEDLKQGLYFQETKSFTDTRSHKEKQQNGYIHTYKPDRLFGFLKGSDGLDYFFHRSAIDDDVLYDKLDNLKGQISVKFDAINGPKGWLAINISMSSRTPDEMLNSAIKYAEDGDYQKAISLIKKLIDNHPNFQKAQEHYEKWREYVLISGLPKGRNPYDRAKRAQLAEKNLDKAIDLFINAIEQDDKPESAIKDLAALYDQKGASKRSIELLSKYKNKISNQQSVDNMLINLYLKDGQYDDAIVLLRKKYKSSKDFSQNINILFQISTAYLRKGSYVEAEKEFRDIVKLQPGNIPAQRNIAICLFKQEKYDDAERQLKRILSKLDDTQSSQLLDEISQSRKTGESALIDKIIIETTFSATSAELTKFAKFFLERCDFQGVSSQSIQTNEFTRTDIKKIEELASQLGTRRPRDRAAYYLSAAKITHLLDEDYTSQFYKYLCRSFASRGDAAVLENKPLDAIQDLYCEALSVYDGDKTGNKDEQDAVNALVRFLLSTLGTTHVPLDAKIPSIDDAVETVIFKHPQKDKFFDAVSYLSMRSLYAANKILNRLYNKHTIQVFALEFLRKRGVSFDVIKNSSEFIALWNKLKSKHISDNNLISDELRILSHFTWKTVWLEDNLKRLTDMNSSVFFSLDKERILALHKIFEMAVDFCKQSVFEEQERLCIQMDGRCQDFLDEINNAPTKFSIEYLHDFIISVKNKVNSKKQELYETSSPQLLLKLALEQYAPDNNGHIEVQVAINNKIGCSPADNIQFIAQEEESLFKLREPEIKVDTSLRGGTQIIVKLPLRILDNAIGAKAFSLPVYVQYRTRTEETVATPINNFSIKLYSEQDFESIENPYAAYAEGGEVGEPEMFYGRKELIDNIAKSLTSSKTQSKCVVIFGQKRSGKSSVLLHLKKCLQAYNNIIPIDVGNISPILENSELILPMFLWTILQKLKYAIEDRVENGFSEILFELPDSRMFCGHPNPLVHFKEIFSNYKRKLDRLDDWKNLQHVVLIDEFSYIYDEIVSKKRVPETFMRHWKALLQDNYFSAVLVGQDVMPKFKQLFPNEFGTTQDERVTYLRREDAERLIDEPIRIGGINGEPRYREKAIARIIELTASSPFYIQILCNRLVDYMNRKHAIYVTEADVEQVKDELIIGVNALSRDKFENLINSGDTSKDAIPDEDIENVLREIALNSRTSPCSSAHISCQPTRPLEVILDDLVKRDVLERERTNYYSIKVGLFKEWLISHA